MKWVAGGQKVSVHFEVQRISEEKCNLKQKTSSEILCKIFIFSRFVLQISQFFLRTLFSLRCGCSEVPLQNVLINIAFVSMFVYECAMNLIELVGLSVGIMKE